MLWLQHTVRGPPFAIPRLSENLAFLGKVTSFKDEIGKKFSTGFFDKFMIAGVVGHYRFIEF